MGSVMETSDTTPSDPIVPKSECVQDGYSSSTASSPEAEVGPATGTQDVVQVQKRKGGRKPIYATSEERKQRNRQAQAAFRERRTEYIKQLETTIKHHEDTLQNLQQSHRSAADECLMLRYKNSLLERILLEKGIDVQAELRMKSSPHLVPARGAPNMTSQTSPMQRAMMNRQQAARSSSASVVPPLQPLNTMMQAGHEHAFSQPPSAYPRPPSQTTSPSHTRPPGYPMQGGSSSPTSAYSPQHPHPQQRSQARPYRHSFSQHPSGPRSPLDPIPDQAYDPQGEMLDDTPGENVDHFVPNYRPSNVSMGMERQPPPPAQNMVDAGGGQYVGSGNHTFDSYDPILDSDPFGLSASMHFPTPYAYDPHQNR